MTSIQFVTPVGRIVAGDPWKAQDKDAAGQPLVIKSGPNAGQPRIQYFLALAINKQDPGLADMFAKINQAAMEGFPTMFAADGTCTNNQFTFKFVDGDSAVPNTRGVAPNTRTGYPGHYVFNLSTGYEPKRVTQGGASEIIDSTQIKRGDYVRLSGNVVGNGSPQPSTAGVFLNWNIVEFQAFGEAILSGPDPKDVFGGAQPTLPAGASTVPVEAPGSPAAPAAPPAAPAPLAAPPVAGAPQPAPTAHTDILNPTGAAPATLDERLTPAAGVGVTWAAMLAKGWTEETAVTAGMLRPKDAWDK